MKNIFLKKKAILVTCLVSIVVIVVGYGGVSAINTDSFFGKKRAIDNEIEEKNLELDLLSQKLQALQNDIDLLENQKTVLQSQIKINSDPKITEPGNISGTSSAVKNVQLYKTFSGTQFSYDYPEGATISASGEVFAVGNISYLIKNYTIFKGQAPRIPITQEDFNNGVGIREGVENYTKVTVDGVLGYSRNTQLEVWIMKNGKTYQIRSLINNSFFSTNMADPVFARLLSTLKIN